MADILFIAGGIATLTISPFIFIIISFPIYKANGGKFSIISYAKTLLK